jgi:hypothetical protein
MVARRRMRAQTALLSVITVLLAAVAVGIYLNKHPNVAHSASAPTTLPTITAPPTTPTSARAKVIAANPIVAENAKKGTSNWRINGPSAGIQGFADHVSVQQGDDLGLYIGSAQKGPQGFHIEAYRMGWYQGLGGRLVWQSKDMIAYPQTPGVPAPLTHMISATWVKTTTLHIDANWPPGDYLLKLVGQAGQSYVPFTLRDDASTAPVLVMNAVTTWQAYNDWGGYSLYHGPRLQSATRADVVSFDRPYSRDGAGDFIANELGLVSLAEHMGLDVSYTTDTDLDQHPELLLQHKVLVSLGHDEYWSVAMRRGVEAARDKGVNVMFLGANAVFRRIRLQRSPFTGADRQEVNYRGLANDPGYKLDPTQPTTSWNESPHADPQNSLTGTYYECNPVEVDGVVGDASSWVFSGTGLRNGEHVQLLIGTEYDRVVPGIPGTPSNIQILFHSPLRCRGHASYADAAYYTVPSGAGVFDTGTGAWVCKLFSGCPADRPFAPNPMIQKITENLLTVFAQGPVGLTHPSQSNTRSLGVQRTTFGGGE